jgi:hypothetical protein
LLTINRICLPSKSGTGFAISFDENGRELTMEGGNEKSLFTIVFDYHPSGCQLV